MKVLRVIEWFSYLVYRHTIHNMAFSFAFNLLL